MTNRNGTNQTFVKLDKIQPQAPRGRGEHAILTSDIALQGPAGIGLLTVLGLSIVGAVLALDLIVRFFH